MEAKININFKRAFDIVINGFEGKYANDKDDPDGETQSSKPEQSERLRKSRAYFIPVRNRIRLGLRTDSSSSNISLQYSNCIILGLSIRYRLLLNAILYKYERAK